MKLLTKTLVLLVAVMLFSMAGYAATSAVGNTVSPTMKVNVNVQSAVQLTLSTATQCPISNGTAPDDYAINFGNVNGLGVGTPTCGTVSSNPGVNATYATDYQIMPSFSGSTGNGTITVAQSFAFTHNTLLSLKEGDSVANLQTLTTTPATISNNAANNTPITRFLGVTVAVQNGAGAYTGPDSSIVTFTLTVP
jgi:hypothetical protein